MFRLKKTIIGSPFIIAFIVIILPQLILKPFGGDLSIVDIGAPLVLFFCMVRKTLKISSTQKILFFFILYILFSFFVMLIFRKGGYIENSPYLIRMLSMYAPVFLVPYMKRDKDEFILFGRIFVCLSLLSTSIIILLYVLGWSNFNAHQTISESDGNLINRLGGLPGESGAFAYNILFIFYMAMIVYFVAAKSWAIKVFSFIIVMLIVFLSFKYSLARVIVICVGAVIIVGYFISDISLAKKYSFFMFGVLIMFLMGVYFSTAIDLSKYRLSNVSGADANSVSSGRVDHWIDGVNLLSTEPVSILFGVGHRMSVSFLGHAVENFFLQNILDYGVIGTLIFVLFLWSILKPIIKNAKLEGGISKSVIIVFTGIFLQWQFNDINTYYQTYPATLFFLCWWSTICNENNKKMRDEK